MTRNVQKTLGIRVALVAAVAFPLIIAMSARAQEPAAAAPAPAPPGPGGTEATAERVIVTGSNIPTAEEVGPNPVDTYRRDDITRLGVRTPTDLIQRIPTVAGSAETENINNGGDGSTRIDLRGIDPKETLILQDGRRLANDGFAGSSVDFNTFPLGLIDHIDILKDGASPVYGSEAVSGVVNVFLIHRFRGLEVYASYGNTNLGFANDRDEESAYLLAGTGDDKTDLVIYAGITNSAKIFSRDFDNQHDADETPFGGSDIRSFNHPFQVVGDGFGFIGIFVPKLNGGALTPTPHAFPNVANDPQYVNLFSLPREKQFFNFADLTPAVGATDREYLYGSITRDICDKYLTFFADFKYVRQFWDSGFAPTPFSDPFTDSANPFGISIAGISVPTQNAFNPFTVADYTSPGGFDPAHPDTAISAPVPGTQFTTGVTYRSLEAGLRTEKITTNNYVFTGGLKGNLGEFANAWDTLKTWQWEAGFRYSEDERSERASGYVNADQLRSELLSTNPATAFNPFGSPSIQSKFVLDHAFATLITLGDTVLITEDLRLTGDMFNIPGGPVSFFIGGEHLGNTTSDIPDPLTQSGQTIGSVTAKPIFGSRDAWSAIWEVRIPVTGPTWNFPGAHSLEFTYAERFEDYSDFGQTERPKFSVRWQPIDESLTLRASYVEAFHAPSLGELFSPALQSFPTINDPITNAANLSQVQEIIRGNPALRPEIAYEYSYGAVLTPGKWWSPLQGLTLSADFVHIRLNGFTTFVDPQFLIEHTPIVFGATTPGPGGSITRSPTGIILSIDSPEVNTGTEILSAWDYEAVETFDTTRLGHGDFGTFTATLNATYLADADLVIVPGGKRRTVVGKYGGGFQGPEGGGAYTHNRGYASLFYDGASATWMQGFDVGAVVHYTGQYWDNKSFTAVHDGRSLERKVREWYPVDIIMNYTFNLPPPAAQTEVAGYTKDGGKNVKMKDGKEKNVMPVSTAEYNPCGWRAWLNNTTFTLGIDNVGDQLPPFVAGPTGADFGYDEVTANPKGRLWFAAIKKRF